MKTHNTIYSRFREQVMKRGGAPAVKEERRSVTYAELDRLAGCVAAALGNSPRRVGVVMDHGILQIAALLGILKAGAAYVPVEPSMPDRRIRFIMDECGVDYVVTEDRYASRLKGMRLVFAENFRDAECRATPEDRSTPEGTAYVLYTSGSTGLPKGVMVSNANVCHYVEAFRAEFHPTPGDVMLQYSVCSFDIFTEEVFTTLLSGAALAIPPDRIKRDIPALMRFVSDNKVTMISGFPYLMLDLNKQGAIPRSLRLLISGGDVLRASFVNKLLPQVTVYNTYGPSETTVCASYFRCNGTEPLPDGTYPIGRPVKDVRIRLLDEKGREVPPGEAGEICITGPGVSQGYLGNREPGAFVTLSDGERMYRSGDLGILRDDGNLLFLHRMDTQVMIMGKRVEPGEVENVLCGCNEVESGVVRPFTDDDGLSYLTAYVVPRDKKHFRVKDLLKALGAFLPSYMIPQFFVKMDSIPVTPNGKVNSGALPEVMRSVEL